MLPYNCWIIDYLQDTLSSTFDAGATAVPGWKPDPAAGPGWAICLIRNSRQSVKQVTYKNSFIQISYQPTVSY